MKKIKLLTFLIITAKLVICQNSIDLPYTLNFDTYNYDNLVWNNGGATFEHLDDSGWKGGAAKFTPPTEEQSRMGLGRFNNLEDDNADQINIRLLIKHGPNYLTNFASSKFMIVVRDPNNATHQRPMVYDGKANDETNDFLSYAPAIGTVMQWDNNDYGGCWISGDERFKVYPGNYYGEWICLEMEFNLAEGTNKLYITTQDGKFSGLYLTQDAYTGCSFPAEDLPQSGGIFSYVDLIGGYFNRPSTSDPDNYVLFDELFIDKKHIGPPQGFVNQSTPVPKIIKTTDKTGLRNYPNPFKSSTTIEFKLHKEEHINLSVYDLFGNKIDELIDSKLPEGQHHIDFDAHSLQQNIYFYKLENTDGIVVNKMIMR